MTRGRRVPRLGRWFPHHAALAGAGYALVPVTSDDWHAQTLTFTADSASTTIAFLADSGYTSRYAGLDDVGVAAVPELAVAALWLAGLGFLGTALRCRCD